MSKEIKVTKIEKDFLQVYQDILHLEALSLIYDETTKIIKANPNIDYPNSFYTMITNGYLTTLIMGIRRQIKINNDSISLLGLLTEIVKNPRYDYALDVDSIKKDIESIKSESRQIEHIADNYIAHLDRRKIDTKAFIKQEEVKRILGILILKTEYYINKFFPTYIFPGPKIEDWATWKNIFKEPWIKDN